MVAYREMRRYSYHIRMLGALLERLEEHGLKDTLDRIRSIRHQLIDREQLTPRQAVFVEELARRLRIELPFAC